MRNRVFQKGASSKRENIEVLLGNAGRTVTEDAVTNMRITRQRGMTNDERITAGVMDAMEELEAEQRRPRKRKYYAHNVGLEEDPRHYNRHPRDVNDVRVGTIDYMDRDTLHKDRDLQRGGGLMRRFRLYKTPLRGRRMGALIPTKRALARKKRFVYQRERPNRNDYRYIAITPGVPEPIRNIMADYSRNVYEPKQYKKR